MLNLPRLLVCLAILLTALMSAVWADNAPELDMLDRLRTGTEPVKVQTRIEIFSAGKMTSQSLMSVYVDDENRSLAVYESQREAGQKVLMVDDQFWLFLPSSKRAMRITPMQKLLGEASVGDIASLNWRQDYKVETRESIMGERRLILSADRRGLSYDRIELWVDDLTLHPLRADFYLKSGKLAKHASFQIAEVDVDQWVMTSMTLHDKVQSQDVTVVHYDSIEPIDMQARWFNPSFLLRNTP